MVKRHFLVRSTLATALLSALVLSQSAHAGLLGGGAGSAGGALGGGFGPRSLEIGGAAAAGGQFSRDAGALPRGDKALHKAGQARSTLGGKAEAAKQAADDKATDGAASLRDSVRVEGAAHGSATAVASPSRQGADRSAGLGLMSQGSAGDPAATRKPQASAGASAEASRSERSVNADGSAQTSVRR